jgi:NCAIR mutase (PurE)-related protein
MNTMDKKELLRDVQLGKLSVEEAAEKLTGFNELGYAKIDTQRKERNGFPEIIYGEGKNLEQIIGIVTVLKEEQKPILATRISSEKGRALQDTFPAGSYFELARCFVLQPVQPDSETYIAIVTAGTSDVPVAEEAAVTAETFGNQVKRIYDVGVAGIHRLFGVCRDRDRWNGRRIGQCSRRLGRCAGDRCSNKYRIRKQFSRNDGLVGDAE